MAEIKISCVHCNQHIQCDESYRGKQIDCPACRKAFQIPVATPYYKDHKQFVPEIMGFDNPVSPARNTKLPKTQLDLHNESHATIATEKKKSEKKKVFVIITVWAVLSGLVLLAVMFLPNKYDDGSNYIVSQPTPIVSRSQPQPEQTKPTNASSDNPQPTGVASTNDNGEQAAFVNANVLYNQQDYANAASAYSSFIQNYPSSARITIVRERLADIQAILNNENAANAEKDKYQRIYQSVISSLPNGESPYPDVFVKGYGSDNLSAFKNAYDSLPADVQGTKGRIHAVDFDGSCCKITFY